MSPRKSTAINLDNELDEEVGETITKEYEELNKKFDSIITKIQKRKRKKITLSEAQ